MECFKALDEHTPGMADYVGNSQFISMGNLDENNTAFLFVMDYPNQTRIKIWGTSQFVEDDRSLLAPVADPDYRARPQRVLLFHVKAWDINCQQHIQRRFTADEIAPELETPRERVRELGAMNAAPRREVKQTEAAVGV